ncbi:MAG: glycosyltransferase [Candidatus Bathyarchaeia archaeon]
MNITIISQLDVAHQPSLLWKGLNEYSQHNCRYIVAKETYLKYPTDIVAGKVEPYEIIEVLGNTDFFIFTTMLTQFPFYDLSERLNRNNHLLITYGSEVRLNSARFLVAWLRSDLMLVTSHDYTQSSPVGFSCQHLPISFDFTELPEPQKPGDDVIRIFHSPTAPKLKGTALFKKCIAKLKKKFKKSGPKIEAVLVEGRPWTECMQKKAQCDIFYDQFSLGSYGMGTVEAWALQLPVLGRANAWLRSWYPDIPIVDVNADSLQTRMEHLITHEDLREEVARQGHIFVREHHSLKKNIRKLLFLIRHVMER